MMTDPASPLERFRASMIIDYEKWHDGIGYDLDALTAAGPEERDAIERLLLEQGVRGWRDVEALARFETPAARAALNAAAKQGDAETRMAVARYAPDLLAKDARAASLVRAIRAARPFEGLSAVV
ncbi:MAG: hypothetical protein KAH44_01945, partial [Oricola sp.]|nr:hypothetical protein [Oricola sp.]